jgi:hypothetical protein
MQGELIESGTVCFSIDGEYLTDLCRDLVTENRWRHALRILTDGVRDLGYENALAVLRGEKKLVGVNDVELVDEDRAEKRDDYLSLLAWQYAGMWCRPDGMWQPYAEVTSFGRADVPSDVSMYVAGDLHISSRWANARVLYYADESRDRTFDEADRVIWRKVEDPPLWLTGQHTAVEALADLKKQGRYLDERGACESAGGIVGQLQEAATLDLEELDPDFAVQVGELEDMLSDQRSFGLEDIAREALGEKGMQALQAILGTQQDDDEPPQLDKDCASEGGYILTDGRFFGCPYMGHRDLARRILRHIVGIEFEGDTEKEADRRNWLRIQPSALRAGKFSIMSPKGRPTKAQEKTLADWCIRHEQQYPENLVR